MSQPKSSRIYSVTTATFIVQFRGSQWSVPIAEAADFAFRVDHWLLRKCADRAGSAEADRDHACANVARADCAHHVVPAAGADEGIFGQHNEKIFSAARI
jgi:hypothetical protein